MMDLVVKRFLISTGAVIIFTVRNLIDISQRSILRDLCNQSTSHCLSLLPNTRQNHSFLSFLRMILTCADDFTRAIKKYTVSYTHLTLPTNREV